MTVAITTGCRIEPLEAMPAGIANLLIAGPPHNIGIYCGDSSWVDQLPNAVYRE